MRIMKRKYVKHGNHYTGGIYKESNIRETPGYFGHEQHYTYVWLDLLGVEEAIGLTNSEEVLHKTNIKLPKLYWKHTNLSLNDSNKIISEKGIILHHSLSNLGKMGRNKYTLSQLGEYYLSLVKKTFFYLDYDWLAIDISKNNPSHSHRIYILNDTETLYKGQELKVYLRN